MNKQNEVKVALDTQERTSTLREIFRAYDIRGLVDTQLTADVVYSVGRAFASEAVAKGQTQVIVGYDARPSSPSFKQAMCDGLMQGGVDVIDIGLVPTPVLYYATHQLPTQSGIMITGSHNPSNYNGIKMVLAGKTLNTDAIDRLYQRVIDEDFSVGQGSYSETEILEQYINDVASRLTLKRPLKVVIDCGNGMGCVTAPKLLKKLGCEVIELYCDVDGTFPNHHPDPTVTENMQDLIASVKNNNADIGLGFDGDADRMGVVSDQGEIIWPDRLMMLFADDLLQHKPGATVVFDVKCSSNLARVIKDKGGEPLMWKTGHSILKGKMLEIDAALAGELSGHIFYREGWFGFDDGVYVAARLLQILSERQDSVHQLFAQYPDGVNTPEIKVMVPEEHKFAVVEALVNAMADTPNATVTTLDGIRIDYDDTAWVLVRASNTTPCLTVRFEAKDMVRLQQLQQEIRRQLLLIEPNMDIPF
ncbi:MAG: phosphomannomutase/phosphoglucomutase [Coxiellaceae bacterium]|nr:phosphomannomutase/phosphoglucomutase [Coxiellaceae bacterium]